jgi:hypothetical protein
MTRADRPTCVMARLARSATAALGTGAYAESVDGVGLERLASAPRRRPAGLGVILIALIVAHGLWKRTRDPSVRERVVLSTSTQRDFVRGGVAQRA